MKKMMRYQVMAGVITLGLLCISAEPTNKPLFRSQSQRIDELERQNIELKKQVEDLNRKIEILSSRVNDCSGRGAGTFSEESFSHAGPSDVPSGLATVRIKPDSSNSNTITAPGGSVTVIGPVPKRKGTLTRMSSDAIVPIDGSIPPTNYQPKPDPADPSSPPPVLTYSSAGSASAPAAADGPALAAGEAAAYKQIKDLLNADQTDLAVPLMEQYLKQHPRGAHEDEIAYRLGDYYYNRGEFKKAIDPLKKVRQHHYTSNVAPDAVYTLGLCYAELGQLKEAQDALEEVESIYSFSDAAPKATKKLESLR